MPRQSLESAVTDFGHAISLLARRVRTAASAHELSWTESAVLARLAREGAATTAELARAENIKPQSMGTTVAALEQMGLIKRRPHPTDGRQVHIDLTNKGAAIRRSSKNAKHVWLLQAIASLNEAERETLLAAGEIVRRLAQK